MQDDELKQEFTPDEICKACGFKDKTFYKYKKVGKIPEPDDTDRKPFTWHRRTILPFIEWYLELKAAREAKKSQPPQP